MKDLGRSHIFPAGLVGVLTTEELERRPARPPDFEAENRALLALARELAQNPDNLLQTLVDTVLGLCHADSAGISIYVPGDGPGAFRWDAVAGQFAQNVGGSIPRDQSPCGAVVDQDAVLLFDRPHRHFTALAGVQPVIVENLLAPFHVDGEPVGTLWAIGHTPERRFDAEDARLLTNLSRFASAGYQLVTALDEATTTRDELEQQVRGRTRDLERELGERRQVEAALRDAKQGAEAASEAKSQFLAVMSHELRTPLTAVIAYTELLESETLGPVSDRQHEMLAQIRASSWNLASIIDEILTLSRAESGKEEVRHEEIDVAGITREVVHIIEAEADRRGLVLQMDGADAPLPVWTDPGKVRQILINLVGNAVKYTDQGEITVCVDRSAPDWVALHVRDAGPGVAPEDQKRIFEPFVQVDGSLTRRGSGAGLGLAICRRLAYLLGGKVTLESAVGEGSTFTLHLPRRGKENS